LPDLFGAPLTLRLRLRHVNPLPCANGRRERFRLPGNSPQ
jgi:hypothetical protein